MTRKFIFTDEAGDFAFKRGPNVPTYFIVCSITLDDCGLGEALLGLRRSLAWDGHNFGDYFHCTENKQPTRDAVFTEIAKHKLRIDATILEKSKALPHVRNSNDRFYKYAWYYHFKHIGPSIAANATELHITTASIGTKKAQAVFTTAVNDVVQQVMPSRTKWVTSFAQSMADPCLQAADYCTWAIQRKWERNDDRSYKIIKPNIATEFDLWKSGRTHHY